MATQKQSALVGKLLENPRQSIYRAAIASGYSHSMAIHPKDIIKGKGFQELLATELDDRDLLTKHKKHLNSANEQTSLKALELAYKIKGRLVANDTPPAAGDTYTTFIQQNKLDINSPDAKTLSETTLRLLMEQTKWKGSDEKNTT